jgi:hypothetical protein
MLREGWPRAGNLGERGCEDWASQRDGGCDLLEPQAGRTQRNLPKTTSGGASESREGRGPALAKPGTELVQEPTPAPEFLIRTINRKKTA